MMNSDRTNVSNRSLRIPDEVVALMSALRLREPNTTALKELSDRQWLSLLDFCDLAHLTLPLAQRQTDGFPSWVIERLSLNLADNIQRFERVKASYKEVAKTLSAAGAEYIVIKGFTQCPNYVELPELRFQSDLDLYCPTEMTESAISALETIGYTTDQRVNYLNADHTPTMIRRGNWAWQGNSFDPNMPLSVELHFCLWNAKASLFSIPGVESFWERRTKRTLGELTFPCLNPFDHLAHLALHILRNIFSRDWIIHHVYELACFLDSHANDDAFWNSWTAAREPLLRQVEAIAFYYARAWFDCQLHQQADNEIANIPSARQQWLRHFSSSSLETMFHENKDSFWLHLTFLTSFQARCTLLKRLFFPRSIASIKSPAIGLKNRRRIRVSGTSTQYLAYLISRSASYIYLSLSTILRGIRWQLSRCQEGQQT